MLLDLRDIIERPGGRVPFSFELDGQALCCGSVTGFAEPPRAEGAVRNCAGVLLLEGRLHADMLCRCDRCGVAFSRVYDEAVSAVLADTDDNPDAYLLEDDCADLSEIFRTVFILSMDSKFLCREDCKGLCPTCGKNLNDGPCACTRSCDPRMAVLEQLLDK